MAKEEKRKREKREGKGRKYGKWEGWRKKDEEEHEVFLKDGRGRTLETQRRQGQTSKGMALPLVKPSATV